LGSLLLALSAGWAWWRSLPLVAALKPSGAGVILGLVSSLPALGLLFVLVGPTGSGIPGGRSLRGTFALIRDFLGPISWWQILVISGMAGLSEEVLFRGAVQMEFGLVAGAVLFGLCHPLGASYIVYAALLGLYLGVVAKLTGGLVAPVIAHALYDAVGLWYLTRRWRPDEGPRPEEMRSV
jgi:membrane protease YdiL (CAAX protease family)